jgi:hypothetical protein
MSSSPSQSTRI